MLDSPNVECSLLPGAWASLGRYESPLEDDVRRSGGMRGFRVAGHRFDAVRNRYGVRFLCSRVSANIMPEGELAR